jgi:uncharacterized protein (TIGR00162 family)
MWELKKFGKLPELKDPVLVEGLPGIGNVGKIVTDFLIEQLKAKKIYDFHGISIPHSVFVNEKNLVELPKLELYAYKNKRGRDLLLLSGDIQPLSEHACYDFCKAVLDVCDQLGCKEIITLGGIGLKQIPEEPKVYCTGTHKSYVKEFSKKTGVSDKLYGIVGPIVGVSGVLVGLAGREKKKGIALLVETYGHPLYLGVKAAQEVLKVLKKYLRVSVDLKLLDVEIAEFEEEMLERTKSVQIPGQPQVDTRYIQ